MDVALLAIVVRVVLPFQYHVALVVTPTKKVDRLAILVRLDILVRLVLVTSMERVAQQVIIVQSTRLLQLLVRPVDIQPPLV